MATYIILNLVFMAIVLLALRVRTIPHPKAWFAALVVLIILTTVFDNLLIYFDVVGYDTSKLLGISVGIAPIEDFFYSLLAIIIVPIIWHKLGETNASKSL